MTSLVPPTASGLPARAGRRAVPPVVRVLSVPARHEYVDAVRPATADPVRPGRTSQWEPDPYLEARVAADWSDEVDLVHLHFGFDHLGVDDVRAWLRVLEATRTPLVLTVHDLRNPHHMSPERHDALLAELVPAAAAVLTLTEGAAREIAHRWGRIAPAVPHPTLVDPRATDDVVTEPGLVTLHLKSLRRNLADPLALVEATALGARDGGGRLRVDLHPAVADDPRLDGLAALAERESLELAVHERFDDLDLQRYLRRSHVTVLPHRWGTHSGWLELARDLGTRAVVPSCGYYREQWPDTVPYANDETFGLDPVGLRAAVALALAHDAPAPADRHARLAEAAEVRRVHAELYGRLAREAPAGVRP